VKFGLSVTGVIHPDRILTKGGARVGDRLILTKPIGTGILTTALKAEMLPANVLDKLVAQMVRLNDKACQAMLEVGAHACTDVTGFALLGHACEMAEASGISIELDSKKIPVIPESLQFAHMGLIPEGMYANWEYRNHMIEASSIDEDTMSVLYDPQTSGGLLISVPADKAGAMLAKLHENGVTDASVIGRVIDASPASQIIVI
jgi:selenide,water dikinase